MKLLRALWDDFTGKRVMNAASLLTYSTLMAIVPVVAVIFAVARGFGYSKYIEEWFRSVLESQPQVVEVILGFVNSYLVHTKSGVVFGIGLLFMLWTIVMLTRNVEMAFNDIWGVRHQRSWVRTFVNYLAMFFVLPILIIVLSAVILWMTSLSRIVNETYIIKPLIMLAIDAIPFVIMTVLLAVLYVFMPNTHVRWRSAMIPAFCAAVCMQLLQFFYVHSQMWVSGYNAIYGSFAALPLFMLWLQLSWTIILVGAELTYTNQNLEDFRTNSSVSLLTYRYRLMISAIVMSIICRRFKEGEHPYTILQIKQEIGLPARIVTDIVYQLQQAHLICETNVSMDEDIIAYIPAESVENITMGLLLSRLDSLHPWEFDVDMHKYLDSPKCKRAMLMYHNHIRAQKDIKLYELF